MTICPYCQQDTAGNHEWNCLMNTIVKTPLNIIPNDHNKLLPYKCPTCDGGGVIWK